MSRLCLYVGTWNLGPHGPTLVWVANIVITWILVPIVTKGFWYFVAIQHIVFQE